MILLFRPFSLIISLVKVNALIVTVFLSMILVVDNFLKKNCFSIIFIDTVTPVIMILSFSILASKDRAIKDLIQDAQGMLSFCQNASVS